MPFELRSPFHRFVYEPPDEVVEYILKYSPLTDFWCSAETYALIRAHMEYLNLLPCRIVDIGCGFGMQAVFFPEAHYIGVNCRLPVGEKGFIPFFHEDDGTYFVGEWPEIRVRGDVFISVLSIGYVTRPDPELLLQSLLPFPCGYSVMPEDYEQILEQRFSKEVLDNPAGVRVSFWRNRLSNAARAAFERSWRE